MKLIGIMSLKEDRAAVRDLFEDKGVRIFSETDILGHSTETIEKFGWFATPQDTADYASLAFAIVEDAAAETVFAAIADLQQARPGDHPIHAFVVPVEKMI
jgi:nitrogen regulatory protein PII